MGGNFLHIHSMYSFNDSTQTPEDIVSRVRDLGGHNVTLTDHGILLGIEPFMDAGKKYGINTIPGVETYIEGRRHLLLVAKNYEGYQAISYAMREANTNIEKSKNKKLTYPIMTKKTIETFFSGNENVIATSACVKGPIADILMEKVRIDEQNRKLDAKVAEFQKAHEEYEAFGQKINTLKISIKEFKDKKKEKHKYTCKAHLNRIESLKQKIADGKDLDGKYQQQLNQAIQNHEDGLKSDAKYDELIAQTTEEIAENKKRQSVYKADNDKYKKAKAAADNKGIYDEKALYEEAKSELLWYKSIFPNFYIEVQYHNLEIEAYVMPILVQMAKETGTPIIAGQDAHMADNSEACMEARRIVRYNYFQKAQDISDGDKELYIKSDSEMIAALSHILSEKDAKEAVDNTAILESCQVVFPEDKHYPSVKTEYSFDELLEQARAEKIKQGIWNDEYEQRLRHEIQVIKNMGYVDYHMVVRDFCNVARLLGKLPKELVKTVDFDNLEAFVTQHKYNCGVGVGPGRGSAAGSLVCYLLGITNVDPMKYNLLFERFLNPERVSMPDIDTDVATSLRPTIIKYLKWKYGEKAVCSIATESSYGAKGAIKMAGRDRADQLYGEQRKADKERLVKEYARKYTYLLSDAISLEPGTTLQSSEKEVEHILKKDPEYQLLWERAKLLEGRIQGTSVHAGGVIISDNDNVNDYIPVAWYEDSEVWAAQCDMVKAEEKGLLKMDLLGLNTLDCISDCMSLVLQHRGINIDIDNIPFEAEVFAAIYSAGNTNSVFQCESEGMKAMLRDFQPTCFEDIILLLAAYRPGPMQYLADIIKVKKGEKQIVYKTPLLEPILSATYGAVIYQEQVMQIFQKLAGYSLGGADLVRRAMSKKKTDKLAHERNAFIHGDAERGIAGCVANGISEQIANELFDEMMDFAKYAFNKSHAAAYAVVSYQTAYLKYHYPVEYMCAMFNNKEQKDYQPLFSDCEFMEINLMPPNINHSYYRFTIEDGNIRYGFMGIKGIGTENERLYNTLIQHRTEEFYESVHDFLIRNLIPKNTEENEACDEFQMFPTKQYSLLVDAGVFDSLGYKRENILELPKLEATNYHALVSIIKEFHLEHGLPNETYNLKKEIELLGSAVSVKKLQYYGRDERYGCIPLDNLTDGTVSVFGLIVSAQPKVSKMGNQMLEIRLHGKKGECNCFLMNRLYNRTDPDEIINEVYKITGKCKGKSIFVESMQPLPVHEECYALEIKTEEHYRLLASVYFPQDEGYEVHVSSIYGNAGGEIKKKDRALLQTMRIPKKKFDYLVNKGLPFEKWNSSKF